MRRVQLDELPERFAAKVEKTEGCWLWNGSNTKGYGMFWLRDGLVPGAPGSVGGRNGRMHPATRIAWYLSTGAWPSDDKDICHTCDNPPCVNPAHLWEGTETENIRDMMSKGRQNWTGAPGGERHPNRRLTDAQVREVLALVEEGVSQTAIGARYGVSQSLVSTYVRGICRKDITRPAA